jgi:hypothetical protein
MAVYFHTHAGPTLVCKYHFNEVVSQKIVTKFICDNGHEHKSKFCPKFCSKCGASVTVRAETKETHSKKKSVDGIIYDLMSEGGFREDIFLECWGGVNCEELVEGHDLFEAESEEFDAILGRSTHVPTKEFVLVHRGKPDIDGEIAKFEEFFAKEIAWLRTKYDAVTVEWMILTNGR